MIMNLIINNLRYLDLQVGVWTNFTSYVREIRSNKLGFLTLTRQAFGRGIIERRFVSEASDLFGGLSS